MLGCTCAAGGCAGSFTLTFRGATTASILHSATAADVKSALQALSSVITSVTVSLDGGAAAVCSTGGVTARVTFTHQHGDIPVLLPRAVSSAALTLAVASDGATSGVGGSASVRGTKEDEPCNNRGLCDAAVGRCTCTSAGQPFASSDGAGASGTSDDCGYVASSPLTCPHATCNGHGVCAGTPTWRCACWSGWTGMDCSLRTCPQGPAWFHEPTENNVAHATDYECGNRGICNVETGVCQCQVGSSGTALTLTLPFTLP